MDVLAEFPSEIEDVYHQTWKRISSHAARSFTLAKTILVWILNASRPMTIEELRHAVATSPRTHKLEFKRLVAGTTLITLCCGPVAIEKETKLVRLVRE